MEWNPLNGLDSFGWYVAPRRLAYWCLVVWLLSQRYSRATLKMSSVDYNRHLTYNGSMAHLTVRNRLPSGKWVLTCSPACLRSHLGMWHFSEVLLRKSRWLVLQNPHTGVYFHCIITCERNKNIFGINFMSLQSMPLLPL
jgi:hypothetical protein